MRITVLGSGQDGGLPQLGAGHPNDRRAREGEIPERTAASLLVEVGGGRLLVDASPDLRVQWWGQVGVPDAVVLTHAHIGHYTGLVHLGLEAANARAVPAYVTSPMAGFLSTNAPWSRLVESRNLTLRPGLRHRWHDVDIDLIPVPHRDEFTDTVAVSLDGRALYLPDIDGWDRWPDAERVIGSHELALVDATFWSADEIPGTPMDRFPHPAVVDTIARFGHLSTRIVLTHLNHTNPLCDPGSPETGEALTAGFEIAHDGLMFEL